MISPPLQDSRFRLNVDLARSLASEFGTPLYVVDETHFRNRIREYRSAFQDVCSDGEISYASKANSTLALLLIAYQEGCSIDVASEGELRAALRAGIPAGACHLHGNNKSIEELEFAIEQGVGHIVVDNFVEIERLAIMQIASKTPLVLRLAPGVDPVTHHKISTGQADTKFGFNISDGSADRAVGRCLELGLNLIGVHCHVGSQLLDPGAQITGGEFLAQFVARCMERHGFECKYLNVGGGLGVMYTDGDRPMNVRDYCRLLVQGIERELRETNLHPKLAQEPGRSLIGESGVTLYQVGVVKTVPAKEIGTRTYVVVDGGLSDNPRPALYGSKYTVELLDHKESDTELRTVTISGKHCETDRLFENVELPKSVKPDDLIQVLCTGAYNSSMASNYNRFPRPATVLVRSSGRADIIQKRETWDEMLGRESIPVDLVTGT